LFFWLFSSFYIFICKHRHKTQTHNYIHVQFTFHVCTKNFVLEALASSLATPDRNVIASPCFTRTSFFFLFENNDARPFRTQPPSLLV
jgi:hypothetical protein